MKPVIEENYCDLMIQTSPQWYCFIFGDYITNKSFEFCQSELKMSSSLASPTNLSFIPAKVGNDMLNTKWEIWLIYFFVALIPNWFKAARCMDKPLFTF